jgi:hypothetical protein
MNIDEWLNTLSEEDINTLCIVEAWRAGAIAMQNALIDKGFISREYEELAREDTKDIIG